MLEQAIQQELPSSAPAVKTIEIPVAVAPPREKSFFEAGIPTYTDKVSGSQFLPKCLENNSTCIRPGSLREECRPWGHWYHTMYQKALGKYTLPDTDPFQFMEIGFVS
jgi:hypothetical protein